jgi:glutamate-1-semialdehyde 2,1-aminomutase
MEQNTLSYTTKKSSALFDFANHYLPGGVSSPIQKLSEVESCPVFIEKAVGSQLVDVDGNSYIDFVNGMGPLILGHSPECVIKAISNQVNKGLVYASPSEWEYKLAKLINSHNPFISKMRFVCSGTEAVMSAIRLAKSYTSRKVIVKFKGSYHGHADIVIGENDPGLKLNIDTNVIVAEFNNFDEIEDIFKKYGSQIAAVILEPFPCNSGIIKPLPMYLYLIREKCNQNKSLLIFDEVITGYRFNIGCVSNSLGVVPDLVTMGKIIGGGMPIGAYGGSLEIMDHLDRSNQFPGGTFAANPVSMAAGVATLHELSKDGFYDQLNMLGELLEKLLVEGFTRNNIPYGIQRHGSVITLIFIKNWKQLSSPGDSILQNRALYGKFHHLMLENGYFLPPTLDEPIFLSIAHTKDDIKGFSDLAITILSQLINNY